MQHLGMRIWFAFLIAAAVPDAAYPQATLADGVWIVIERCSENKRTNDPKLRSGFDRQTHLTVDKGSVVGHERNVREGDGSVTLLAYEGKIDGTKITITGTGIRVGTRQPWSYSYEGAITSDGYANLKGGIYQQLQGAEVQVRSCSLTFLAPKEAAAGATPSDPAISGPAAPKSSPPGKK